MGKTPKKAAPGGDERNLYVRRLKATTAPSRASESSFLPERQSEFEGSNRQKLTGLQKKIPTGSGKNFKSKLRAPAKVGLSQATKQLKPMKNPETKTLDMQPESEEMGVKLNVSVQKENVEEEKVFNTNKVTGIEESTTAVKECDSAISEQISSGSQTSTKTVQETIQVDSGITYQEKEEVPLENIYNIGTKEMEEENDIVLKFEQNFKNDEKSDEKRSKDDSKKELPAVENEQKNDVNEKEEIQSESQTDTENSVDIVESTTTEVSSVLESTILSEMQQDKEKNDGSVNNDESFISYDSSIMLKDVQIKLNDCLKNNSKLVNVSNAEDMLQDAAPDTQSQFLKDISFIKSIRDIPSRQARANKTDSFITVHERKISPNSSLFVNTSTMSMPQNEETEHKILHYNSGLSDSFPTNGNSCDRKRKIHQIDIPIWNPTKKQKTENSLLNTSIGFLKNLRRPIQVSTPNPTSCKLETKLDISAIKDDDNKVTTEPTESTKKWCIIM